jgi:CheY-like chemotaxis protein/uncharacterized C2H2 Zn-finger protein
MSRRMRSEQTALALEPRPAILVVEADPDTRALYHEIFPAEKYSIEECDDGAEALGRAICRPPDVIITETRIQRIDGFMLSKLLRADVATRHIPIVVVTGAHATDRLRAMRAGATTVIAKPFDLDEIVATVREILGRTDAAANPPADTVADAPAADSPRRGRAARLSMSHGLHRHRTTTPELPPPSLRCPRCDAHLVFQHSYVGGVNHRSVEQWDYLACSRCGVFQYRHRTRVLKPAP